MTAVEQSVLILQMQRHFGRELAPAERRLILLSEEILERKRATMGLPLLTQ